jgi:hypothetical protein
VLRVLQTHALPLGYVAIYEFHLYSYSIIATHVIYVKNKNTIKMSFL